VDTVPEREQAHCGAVEIERIRVMEALFIVICRSKQNGHTLPLPDGLARKRLCPPVLRAWWPALARR
jgi:hypothetical protein